MKKNNKSNFSWEKAYLVVVFAIIGLAIFLRLFRLDQFPPQLNRDEAAIAMNAYLIDTTHKDEWGKTYPLQFQSFGDYKLPGYIYLVSFLFHFIVNDYMVRLPSALAGILLIISSAYFLSTIIQQKLGFYEKFFFISLVAFSPFAFFYSRMGWEANLSLLFFVTSLALLYEKKSNFIKQACAYALMIVAVLTYNSALILLPCIMFSLPFVNSFSVKKSVQSISLLTLIFIGGGYMLLQTATQKSGITFFHDGEVLSQYVNFRASFPGPLKIFLGNKVVYFASLTAKHFFATLGPNFLVIQGGKHPWHSILGRGHIYANTYVFFMIGIMSQIKIFWDIVKQVNKRTLKQTALSLEKLLPLYLLLVSPLPAIFTTDAPHATRSLFTLLMVLIFAVIGLSTVFTFIKSINIRYITMATVTLLIFAETSLYLFQYFYLWPPIFSPDMQIGLRDEIISLSEKTPQKPILIAGGTEYLYSYVVWYTHMSPEVFNTTVKRTGPEITGLYNVVGVGDFTFVRWKSQADYFSGYLLEWNRDTNKWIETER